MGEDGNAQEGHGGKRRATVTWICITILWTAFAGLGVFQVAHAADRRVACLGKYWLMHDAISKLSRRLISELVSANRSVDELFM
jgi:hypothetical protein